MKACSKEFSEWERAKRGIAGPVPTVRVPAKFFRDHDERECEPACSPVRHTDRFVWVAMNDPGLDELLDDARHYASPESFDDEYIGLRRSAAATVSAIESARQHAPKQSAR
jgi:hypothetical protein